MSREYFCAYYSYLASMRNLSDAECGRLFRALLQYGSAGDKSINLQGRESIAFDFMAAQIDRDNEAYSERCQKNKDNIQKRYTTEYDCIRPNTKPTKEKEKEKKNITPPTPSRGDVFDSFWSLYPKKVGKQAALNAWRKIKPDSALSQKILDAVERQRTWEQWVKNNGQYIPNPATWLNQGRWDDECASDPLKEVDRYADLI